jgi:hypothetical protein
MMLRLRRDRNVNFLRSRVLALAALEDGFLLLLVVVMRLERTLEEALVLGEGFFAFCVEGCWIEVRTSGIGIWICCRGERSINRWCYVGRCWRDTGLWT